jgi:uncharacterized membrane protein
MHRREIRSRIVGVNVPTTERIVTGIAGAAAIVIGARRRSLGGIVIAAGGVGLIVRALAGLCPFYRARAIRKGIQVRRAITIQGSARPIYDVWRDFENLARIVPYVDSVEIEDERTSRWTVKAGPARLSWRAEIVEDVPGRRLRWRSLPGGAVVEEGQIDFREAPADRGTVVEVKLHYMPPGGLLVASTLSDFLRALTGEQVGQALARLQQLVETGELATGARRPSEVREEDRAISVARVHGSKASLAQPGGAR